jgi:DNA-binding NarL/FixJ family response regulator
MDSLPQPTPDYTHLPASKEFISNQARDAFLLPLTLIANGRTIHIETPNQLRHYLAHLDAVLSWYDREPLPPSPQALLSPKDIFLIQHLNAGYTVQSIAAAQGRSRAAVYQRLQKVMSLIQSTHSRYSHKALPDLVAAMRRQQNSLPSSEIVL